jgi:DNA-binding ferritin-like protein
VDPFKQASLEDIQRAQENLLRQFQGYLRVFSEAEDECRETLLEDVAKLPRNPKFNV